MAGKARHLMHEKAPKGKKKQKKKRLGKAKHRNECDGIYRQGNAREQKARHLKTSKGKGMNLKKGKASIGKARHLEACKTIQTQDKSKKTRQVKASKGM